MRRIAWIAAAALVLAGCGGAHGVRPPSDAERGAITRWVDRWWRVDPGFSAVRKLGLHDVVSRIGISQRDPHFAAVNLEAIDRHGKRALETAQLGLVLVAGKWTIAIGPGTDLSEICTESSPRPLVDLFC
jgi:hypothetical protein